MKNKLLFIFFLLLSPLVVNGQKHLKITGNSSQKRNSMVAPVALPATNIKTNGFDANWEAVSGAEAYCVYVYTRYEALKDETVVILNEDFSAINFGSITAPVYSTEIVDYLDAFTNLPDWIVYGYASYAKGMVGGVIYTPYMDVRNDNGTYQVYLSVYGLANDEIHVTAAGSITEKQSFKLTESGLTEKELTFTNGTRDTYLSIINTKGETFFLDDIAVMQNLKKGDSFLSVIALNEEVVGEKTTKVSFDDLYFRHGVNPVYYSVMAVFRDYNIEDPMDYEQYYSDYSNLIEVDFSVSGITSDAENSVTSVYPVSQELHVNTPVKTVADIYSVQGMHIATLNCIEGDNALVLEKGLYLVNVNNKSYKIFIPE